VLLGRVCTKEQGFPGRWQCWIEALVPTREALIRRVQAPIQECVNFTSSLWDRTGRIGRPCDMPGADAPANRLRGRGCPCDVLAADAARMTGCVPSDARAAYVPSDAHANWLFLVTVRARCARISRGSQRYASGGWWVVVPHPGWGARRGRRRAGAGVEGRARQVTPRLRATRRRRSRRKVRNGVEDQPCSQDLCGHDGIPLPAFAAGACS
jgi:hypothetical protein